MTLIKSTHRGKAIYRVRWNYWRDENGKQHYDEKRFRNRSEAARFDREKSAGNTLQTETITVAELADRWFIEHVSTLQLRTQKDYRCNYEKRVRPWLGAKQVSKVTPLVMREWKLWMLALPTGARTVNKTMDMVKAMVGWGRGEGLCANTDILKSSRMNTPKPKPANPYTPTEVQTMVDGCEFLREATLIALAAYSGLRWSELRALRWADIDMTKGQICLTRSLDLDKSTKATKSDEHRIVPILRPGRDALKLWRQHSPNIDLVFPTSKGKPLGENNWYNQRLPKIREKCGINFDLHELRDTYASILIQSGIGEAELTLWLGHKSIQTTLDRYGKLFESRKATLVSKADEALAAL